MKELRDLVVRLHEGDVADGLPLVLADRCEELGFERAAAGLRMPPDDALFHRAVWTLTDLLGVGSRGYPHPYTAVHGLREICVAACENVPMEIEVLVSFRLRRLVLAGFKRESMCVSSVRVGLTELLLSAEAVPAVIFSESSFDTFDHVVPSGSILRIVFESHSRHDADIHGCLLGDVLPLPR